ncbi:DNA methyltransferase 1-associated protein 1 [Mizuhopecten yessoensis]|uniref:DNA methyltransferase 1-associated protein 1 n=1 Tax=Mizuhopecten yessoensis TaxID=6573 RepID=A0A210QB71_MIZYE|nr:DNA methyltransferase 1-associated protein 1 [Mizuhopecten yessoensis]
MAGSDVRDILDIDNAPEQAFITKDALMNKNQKKVTRKSMDVSFKRPEGMHREVWGLLWTDNKDSPPIIPTDTNQGYKQMKAKIGSSKVRPWKWMPFSNPARKDGAIFYHWRREADEGKDYPFARFNKASFNSFETDAVDVPVYSDLEYQQHLHDESWTRQETDHLFDLCKRFDLRFLIIHDRWDREKFLNRSVEDLKERYYSICNNLTKVYIISHMYTQNNLSKYIISHTCTHKTISQKEEHLIAELKKIELRKKEREKKTQDLQKLITAADSNIDSRRAEKKHNKKKVHQQQKLKEGLPTVEPSGIKFADFKASGVSLRSQRMKLPASIGQKKTKAIEQVLEELGIEYNPMPTEDIVTHFNELRQDIVLLYELKLALATCDYEVESLRHRFETLAPGKTVEPDLIKPDTSTANLEISSTFFNPVLLTPDSPSRQKKLAEAIDVVGTPGTPNIMSPIPFMGIFENDKDGHLSIQVILTVSFSVKNGHTQIKDHCSISQIMTHKDH